MSNQHLTFTTYGMYGTTVYGIAPHRPDCFSTVCLGYTPHVPPTPEEVAVARMTDEAYEAACAAGYVPPESNPAPHGYFRTAAAAQRATELHDAMNAAAEEIDAFDATSECLALACKPLMRELEALEAEFGTRLNPPTLGEQYAERGLPDPTRPIAESLPAGMHDDRDILAALGERSAIDPDDCYAGVHPSNY